VNRRLEVAKPAVEELTAAVRWYEQRRPGLGARFFDAVVRTLSRILALPDSGSPVEKLEARRTLVAGFPYQVVYRLHEEKVLVIAFAHVKRRPGFWRRRL